MQKKIEDRIEKLMTKGKKKGRLAYEDLDQVVRKGRLTEEEKVQLLERIENEGIRVFQKSAVREWVESIVIAFILAMFIREFFFQAFRIPSGSMRMTLLEGDRLLVNKMFYGPKLRFTDKRMPGFTEPQRGDVIVFIYPDDPKRDFIKRLIAFGGETVRIKEGNIYIDGELLADASIKNRYYYNRGQYGQPEQVVEVPEGHYFVLGDNSGSSSDSRYWGFVPEENVIGKAYVIYWPLTRMRIIK